MIAALFDITEDKLIAISLRRAEWDHRVSVKAKVHPLSTQDKEAVDKTFGKLHRQGCLKMNHRPYHFLCPLFEKPFLVAGKWITPSLISKDYRALSPKTLIPFRSRDIGLLR